MNNYNRAFELSDEIIENRRYIHKLAEVGMDTSKTAEYVIEKLIEMGYSPKQISKNSVVATVGNGGKTILLRADMDALPIQEETGLKFASTNGNSHACGHDSHTAMLLGAAKILKEQENNLKGTVKLMFQPGEELLIGAKEMVDAGVLKNPDVDSAITCHINSTLQEGIYIKSGAMTAASYNFKITISGKGCHGAMPEAGIDPVLAGAHVLIGLQEILSREISFVKGGVLTTGHFKGGSAPNVIPNEAIIEGTMRTFDNDTYLHAQKRVEEIACQIANAYRCEAKVEALSAVPVVVNDETFVSDLKKYIDNIAEGNFQVYEATAGTGSEDFSLISEKVPACMLRLGAPDIDSDTRYPLHHPKVKLNEKVFPIGSAVFAECAIRWLEEHSSLE